MRTFAQKPRTTQPTTSAKTRILSRAYFGQGRDPNTMLNLQRTIGNQAVQQLLQTNAEELEVSATSTASPRFAHDFSRIPVHHRSPADVQARITVSSPGDRYEQEADRVAEQVMPMPESFVQRQAEEEDLLQAKPQITPLVQRQDETEEESLQAKPHSGHVPVVQPSVSSRIAALRGGGRPLPQMALAFFEPRFGVNFGGVRVHTGVEASSVARSVQARAFTIGQDVVFGSGEYVPGTLAGIRFLAHELTHVVQQQGAFRSTLQPMLIQRQPTGIKLKEAKPFGHGDLISDGLKKKWRTYIGSTTLMQVTPSGNYKGHCVKEYLTEVANTCPSRFTQLRKDAKFCTESKCLDFDRWGRAGDASTKKMVSDGPDTFLDRHRTRHPQSLLEGTGKKQCSVVCHQLYKYDRKKTLGAFYVIRNFKAGSYTPTGTKTALHITTGDVQKVKAPLRAPSKADFSKAIAPGLEKRGKLLDKP